DEGAQRLRHAGLDLQPNDRTAAASLERGFVKADQIFRLLLDLDVAVADDPKGAFAEHFVTGEEQSDERDDQAVEGDKARGHTERAVRQPHETLDAAWNAHERAHRSAVLRIEQFERQGESKIGNERERMRRIDREGRENRKDVLKEVFLQPVPLATRQIRDVENDDSVRR